MLAVLLSMALSVPAALPGQAPGKDFSEPSVLQIRILEGEGIVHTAGSRKGNSLTVQVTDETGRPVPEATVSFRLPEDGPGGLFVNDLKTTIATTDKEGRANVSGIRWNRTPGPFQIRITALKGQARAGTVSSQYIDGQGGTVPAQTQAQATAPVQMPPRASAVGLTAASTPVIPIEKSNVPATTAPVAASASVNPRLLGPVGPVASTTVMPKSRKKWLIIGGIVAGAAVGGLAVAMSSGKGGGSTPASQPPQIGAPSISVGRP